MGAPVAARGRIVVVSALALLLVVAGLWLAGHFLIGVRAQLLLIVQVTLLAAALTLAPTISYRLTRGRGRVLRVAFESALFVGALALFYFWVWGKRPGAALIAYAVGLVLLIEIGSHLIEWNKGDNIRRLSRSDLFRNLRLDVESLEAMFRREQWLYAAVPLGLVAGAAVGALRAWEPRETVLFCLQLSLWLASLVLLYFLAVAFARLADPLYSPAPPEARPAPPAPPKKQKRRGRGRVQARGAGGSNEERERASLDLACMISDLRKIYFYDAMHNVVLLVVFAAVALRSRDVEIDERLLTGVLVALTFLLTHLPYVIGQSKLYEKILEPYDGLKRAEIGATLKEHAPMFPKWEALAILVTSSPAGMIVYFFFEESIHHALTVSSASGH
ncbi:MAG: hypothetical protein M3268_04985 [Acidobacteriota bacterium]|nr:hypothetical protein [Acidobacteriota bacterium]